MSSLEETFRAACRDREIPGAVLVATDKTGKFRYSKSFGVRSLEDGHQEPLEQDAIMGLASCTKLLTSIAALQCVERGLLQLDEDVARVLPEFKDIEIISEADEPPGELKLKKATKAITLRHVLTYGAGHDWTGKMVERVNPSMTLETYFEKYIWQPLGIKDMTFFVEGRPELKAKKAGMSIRKAPDEKATPYDGPIPYEGVKDCMGGQGLSACAPEYLKVIHSLLADDGNLLKKEGAAELFTPQLTELSQKALMKLSKIPDLNNLFGATLPIDCEKDWGLGVLLCLDHIPGWRSKGTMTWTGLPNLCWFIDREAELCGMYASQIMPPGDPKSIELQRAFERAMYERSKAATARM